LYKKLCYKYKKIKGSLTMAKFIIDEEFYDIKEVAEELGVSSLVVRSYIAKGRLKGRKIGTKWYFSINDIKKFLETPTEPGKRGKK